MPFSFYGWMGLLNNFSIEVVGFSGREIGILQTLREIPGFLAFTAIFLLLFMRESRLAVLALTLLAAMVSVTGFFPSVLGLYATTVLMSIGFHYFEAMQLATIWNSFKSSQAARKLGRQIGSKSLGAVGVFTMLWFASEVFGLSYKPLYMMCGGVTLVIVLFIVLAFPEIKAPVQQAKKPVLRKQYWLYYALTLMSGARRQIFVVFAGFLMVEKFHYSIGEVALLFLANNILQIWLAPYAGRLIERWGERNALLLEYSGLLFVFLGYVVVSDARVAGALYLLDHIFFSLTIAMNSYFRHIARPQDISASAAVGFTINHVAAVVLPVTLGFVWLVSPGRVFLLVKQYVALLATEGVKIQFTEKTIDAIADLAVQMNNTVENIGARRLHTVMEKLLEDVSFRATDMTEKEYDITAEMLDEKLRPLLEDNDLSRFIL